MLLRRLFADMHSVSIAMSIDTANLARQNGKLEFFFFARTWPKIYDRKWIPFADSADEAIVVFEKSGLFEENLFIKVLTVYIPHRAWIQMEDQNMWSFSPGLDWSTNQYMDVHAQRPYGSVLVSHDDPSFQSDVFPHEWQTYILDEAVDW